MGVVQNDVVFHSHCFRLCHMIKFKVIMCHGNFDDHHLSCQFSIFIQDDTLSLLSGTF